MKINIAPIGSESSERMIASSAAPAAGFSSRLMGLMFRKSFGGIDALILSPCSSIHTLFMRFPIDVVCLDASGIVSDLMECLSPWKIFIPRAATLKIVELPAGSIRKHDIRYGDVITLVPALSASLLFQLHVQT